MSYTLKELLDVSMLRELLDSLDELHCMPSAIMDPEGNILTATAWQDICARFHRINPATGEMCLESDRHAAARLMEPAPHAVYRCPMGLVDAVMPVIIEGVHLGNVFTGQLFTESPDEAYFINQARAYGFDENAYLEALHKVPLFSEDKLHKNLNFIHDLTQMLAEQGLQNIRLREAEKHNQLRSQILEMLARDASLADILESIVLSVEQESGLMLCSILLLDSEGKRLHLGAAPTLPAFYNAAIEGFKIGDGVGSCGTAAFTGERVIVSDIASHPYWVSSRGLAAKAGLAACWSEPVRSSTGKILGTFAVYHRDIHVPTESEIRIIEQVSCLASIAIEKKIAAEAMRASEERHRTIIKTAMDGIWMADTQGRLLEVNQAYCAMSGYSEQELLTMTIPDLEALETPQDTADRIKMIMELGEARFESQQRRKDGTVFDVEVSVQYRPVESGQLVTFIRDITERKQAEDAVRESDQKFRSFFEHSVFGKSITTMDGKLKTNAAFRRMVGYSVEELEKLSWQDITHPDCIKDNQAIVDSMIAGEKESAVWEKRYLHKDGHTVWASISSSLLRDPDGNPLHFITTVNDITEAKMAEEEKIRLQEQLMQSQKLEAIGQLAGGVAHDFNNMLGVIIGHAELALMKLEPTHPLFARLTEIRSAAERSADLTRQLLAFARKQTIAPKVIDLNETITGMLKMLQRLIGENIHLTWQPAPELWQTKVDPSQIDQLLANLCVNARDAITDVGRITIETGNCAFDSAYCDSHSYVEPGEYVQLVVSDDGVGMDKETQMHIFEPFFTTKGVGEGTGLGLATVYGIIKQNNGFINVHSEPGQGTTFTIYLPRHAGEEENTQNEGLIKPVLRGSETILLVEDEPANLKMAAMLLQELGYTVLTAGTAAYGVRRFKEQVAKIHMLITDVIMPDMNGRDLINELRLIDPQLKCLFMSGYTADVIAHHGVLDEGVQFIQKPFSMSDLAAKVREVLESKQAPV